MVAELLRADWPVEHILTTQQHEAMFGPLAAQRGAAFTLIGEGLADYLRDAETAPGVLAVGTIQRRLLSSFVSSPSALILILDSVSDPGNVGAMMRTAAAFGCAGVVLLGDCADEFSPKTIRASAGSLFHIPVARAHSEEELLSWVAASSLRLTVASARAGRPPWANQLTGGVAIAFGHETRGVSPRLEAAADARVTLPTDARVESLNVAAAAAAILAEATRQRAAPSEGSW